MRIPFRAVFCCNHRKVDSCLTFPQKLVVWIMSSKPKSEDEVVNSENSRPINSFYDEENSVKLDGSAHDLLQFRDCCESLREFIKNTWQRKKSQEKVNASPFAFLMITIKELNRRTQFRIRKSRETTAENKNKVDQLHLSLQNLLYEVTHLENEIQTCLEFKSRHEDIKLIPLEEFYEKTGHKVGSLSEHEETLERLYWELEQRKALSDSCDKLKSAVESTSQTIRKKRNYLASFGPKLKDVAEVSYISQWGKKSELSVSIEGDSELAKAVNQTTEQLESQSSPQEADDSDLEDGEGNKKRKKKRYATEHVDDTDKEPTNEKVNNLHPLTVLLTVSIPKNADIPLSEYDFSITLSFAWILNLNLVTTSIDLLNSEQLLSNLPWSCDKRGFGDCSSDMPILLIPDSQKSITWNACESIGRPYSWAQQLSGINCFPDRLPDYKFSEQSQESTESDHFGEIESWIKSLQSRIIDRLYLIEELSEIERSNLVLSPEQQLLIPSDIELRIIRWKDSDFETLQSVPRAQVMIALNLVRSEDAIFQCHFGKNENSFVTVWVCVPPQYPHKAPLLIMDGLINYASSNDVCDSEGTVTDLSDLHIQELETEVNCYWQEFFTSSVNQNNCHIIVNDVDNINIATSDNIGNLNKSSLSSSQCIGSSKWRRNILSCQLARCASCIDALCRDQMIWKNSLKSTNNSSVRSLKYPTRSRPLRYLPSPGAFVHR
ncbi:THO complex subunit 5 like [Schistosoma japonicum]|nr:THO complex subunit 5 like [Schistosoma japonicum]